MVVAVNRMPAADVEVSADLVRRLLAAQHPDLARLPVEFLANGWDNELYRVGDELVARLPRRAPGAQIIKNEQRWLPGLAARLPLPVLYPERTGVSGCGYPYSWSVVPYLPGVPAAQAGSFDLGRAAAAVGVFLGALHVPAPADAPANPFRGVPLAERAGTFAANLALLAEQVDRDAVLREWVTALAAPGYDGPPVWLHGDLHPANILVDDGQVSGVIDFGDITAGDPASDLAVAWMLLPSGCHPGFWSAYQAAGGQGGDALRARAKGWALNFATVFLAHSQDNPVLREVGRRTLRAVLADQPGLFLNGPAHGSQVIAETQGGHPLALGQVAVELHLTAQGDACAELSGLAPFGVADRLRQREDFPGATGRHEQHAIVIAQDQVLAIHGPLSHRGGGQRIGDPGIETLRAGRERAQAEDRQPDRLDVGGVAMQPPDHDAVQPRRLSLKNHQVADAALIEAPVVVDYQHVARFGPVERLEENIDAAGIAGGTHPPREPATPPDRPHA